MSTRHILEVLVQILCRGGGWRETLKKRHTESDICNKAMGNPKSNQIQFHRRVLESDRGIIPSKLRKRVISNSLLRQPRLGEHLVSHRLRT